jgi:hypothetical protein
MKKVDSVKTLKKPKPPVYSVCGSGEDQFEFDTNYDWAMRLYRRELKKYNKWLSERVKAK